MARCTIPPPHWRCTREAGHDGPCAAIPVNMTITVPCDYGNERHIGLAPDVFMVLADALQSDERFLHSPKNQHTILLLTSADKRLVFFPYEAGVGEPQEPVSPELRDLVQRAKGAHRA